MITALEVENFKRFAKIALPLRPMTVLTGLNGTGKSTLIQAMLLARQVAENPASEVVQINGVYNFALGEANEVLHADADRTQIEVRVHTLDGAYRYLFGAPDEVRSLNLPILSRPASDPEILTGSGMAFTYLTADRLGPRDQLDVSADDHRRVGVGVRGEFTAQALALHESAEVPEARRHERTVGSGVVTLRTQLEYWASDIIRPIQISAHWPPGINASVIRFQDPDFISEPIRPANMGYGVSYSLPIIIAGLLTPPAGLIIVENPEAHLHPAGQSRLGRFLARVAGSGVQIVVETHSDHVVNGIRLGAAVDTSIDPASVVVYFFGAGGELAQPIQINDRGEFSAWPTGFFDQIEDDLERLSRARRRGD